MKIEHMALNVADPVGMAAWYCQHLGMRVVRHSTGPSKAHFIADEGATILEIYCNPPDKVPDYRSMDPLQFHLAFHSADPVADSRRLQAAGASFVSESVLEDGSQLAMLRDPWGVPLQLCKRAKALL